MSITRTNRLLSKLSISSLLAHSSVSFGVSQLLPRNAYQAELPFRPLAKRHYWGFSISFKLLVLAALLGAMAWSSASSATSRDVSKPYGAVDQVQVVATEINSKSED